MLIPECLGFADCDLYREEFQAKGKGNLGRLLLPITFSLT